VSWNTLFLYIVLRTFIYLVIYWVGVCCVLFLLQEGDDLIAPCHCKGTQKYVHRSCLDNWRSTKVLIHEHFLIYTTLTWRRSSVQLS
jgi:E3 ubiquitin-protein ligase DOA10